MAAEVLSSVHADHNLTSECALIGAIFRKPDLHHIMKVRTVDFEDSRLRVIYETMGDLVSEGIEIDTINLVSYLINNEKLATAGGAGFISQVESDTWTVANWEYHQDIVMNHSLRRQLEKLATQVTKDLKFNNISIKDYLQTVEAKLGDLVGYGNNTNLLAKNVKEWCLGSDGVFQMTDLYRDLGISKQKGQEEEYRRTTKTITMIMSRLVKQDIIERVGSKRGHYRLLDRDLEEIDFRCHNVTQHVDLRLPLDLHELVYTYPKNIIIIAGESNAGKTAFMMETLYLNDQHLDMIYFSCEGGKQELQKRLRAFDRPIDDWRFRAWERYDNFADVIHPDKVNLIDYLEVDQEFYMVGQKISKISERLEKGIAIIAIQKDARKKLAIGGQFTKHRSRLYIAMGPKEITLEKAKNPINPAWKLDGKKIKFELQGPHFINLNPRG